jgi:23S rRNA (adenine2030-N6)-methyltransferase
MLSYQHSYHAGNLADVHKHAVLASILSYLIKKDKPVTYIETHSGRGLYDLGGAEALKTREASFGIANPAVLGWFPADHPYRQVIDAIRAQWGQDAYPGSPLLAAEILRAKDVIHLAELHPAEYEALATCLGHRAHIYQEDGFRLAERLCPPTPRRGILMVDPSYELDSDYATVPRLVERIHSKWNVGMVLIWYPLLLSGCHQGMVQALSDVVADGVHHQVRFPVAREGHRMVGSGLFLVKMPYGLDDELIRLSARFDSLLSAMSQARLTGIV